MRAWYSSRGPTTCADDDDDDTDVGALVKVTLADTGVDDDDDDDVAVPGVDSLFTDMLLLILLCTCDVIGDDVDDELLDDEPLIATDKLLLVIRVVGNKRLVLLNDMLMCVLILICNVLYVVCVGQPLMPLT